MGAFFSDEFNESYKFHGIKVYRVDCSRDSGLFWPSLECDDRFDGVIVRQAVKMTVWARNTQLTISVYSPLEIATGRRPPDLVDVETSNPEHLTSEPPEEVMSTLALQRLAVRAHQEARQSADLRHDTARRTLPSDGPYRQGDEVLYWLQESGKFKDKGKWILHIHTDKAVIRVNQSKVRRDHDEWHGVAMPNLDEGKQEIKDEDEMKREDHKLLREGCV